MSVGSFLLGVMPSGGVRMAIRFGDQAVLVDFDRRTATRVGRDLDMLGEIIPDGGLPSGWSEDAPVNRIVDGCVEAFGQVLERRPEALGEVGVSVRLTVLGITSDVEIAGRPALQPLEQFGLEEADPDVWAGGWAPLDRWRDLARDEPLGDPKAHGHDGAGGSAPDAELVAEDGRVQVGGDLDVGQPPAAPMSGREFEGGGDEARAARAADLGADGLKRLDPQISGGDNLHGCAASISGVDESRAKGARS